MPPSGVIIPALPLNNVPPSPRSVASETTDRSRDSDEGIDQLAPRVSQISLMPYMSVEVHISCPAFANASFHGHLIQLAKFLDDGDGDTQDLVAGKLEKRKVLVLRLHRMLPQ
jgi:hypothetical protein